MTYYRLRISDRGRMTLPREVREQFHLENEDEPIIASYDYGIEAVVLRSLGSTRNQLRKRYGSVSNKKYSDYNVVIVGKTFVDVHVMRAFLLGEINMSLDDLYLPDDQQLENVMEVKVEDRFNFRAQLSILGLHFEDYVNLRDTQHYIKEMRRVLGGEVGQFTDGEINTLAAVLMNEGAKLITTNPKFAALKEMCGFEIVHLTIKDQGEEE